MAIFGRRGDPVGSPGSEKPASLRSHAQPSARIRSGAICNQLRSLLDFRLTEQWFCCPDVAAVKFAKQVRRKESEEAKSLLSKREVLCTIVIAVMSIHALTQVAKSDYRVNCRYPGFVRITIPLRVFYF